MLLLILFQGCRKERPGFERNLPPETFLSSVPMDSSFVFYRVRLFWGGMDPDDQVVGFYYAVVDSNLVPAESTWVWTTDSEKEFSLLANNPEMLGHRFFVKAVDERGLEDPTPAFLFFYARDFNLPKITYTESYAVTLEGERIPLTAATFAQLKDATPGDTVPTHSVAHFSWRGWDSDPGGYVTGYLYKTSDAGEYRGGTLADTSATIELTRSSQLNFEVVATDDAGAMSRRDSLRYFVVNFDPDTWILPPCPGCCADKQGKGFTEDGSIPRCEGDTLRLIENVGVSFSWWGWDKDGWLKTWSYRLLIGGGGKFYQSPPPSDSLVNTYDVSLSESNEFKFLVRARDNEGRDDGTPASVRFYTNCAPFFENEQRCCGCPGGTPETCTLPCTNSVVVLAEAVYDSVNCPACDIETAASKMSYRYTLNGRQGSWIKGESGKIFLTKSLGLVQGLNTLQIEAMDQQPDGTDGRVWSTTRQFNVDVAIP